MARYLKGDVVSVNSPFSSDAQFKFRPAIVLASWPYLDSRDYLVCMISKEDTIGGAFQDTCYIRPTYTFAASERRMQRKICSLKVEKLKAVLKVLHELIDQ